jgi:hypothetical protein
MDFTDDSEVRDQPSTGGNSRFLRNVTTLLPFWRTLSRGKVRPAGGHAKKRQRKDAASAALPVLENFWPTKHTNDTT